MEFRIIKQTMKNTQTHNTRKERGTTFRTRTFYCVYCYFVKFIFVWSEVDPTSSFVSSFFPIICRGIWNGSIRKNRQQFSVVFIFHVTFSFICWYKSIQTKSRFAWWNRFTFYNFGNESLLMDDYETLQTNSTIIWTVDWELNI